MVTIYMRSMNLICYACLTPASPLGVAYERPHRIDVDFDCHLGISPGVEVATEDVDIFESQVFQPASSTTEPAEKAINMPASIADRMGRKPLFALHPRSEILDFSRIGFGWGTRFDE